MVTWILEALFRSHNNFSCSQITDQEKTCDHFWLQQEGLFKPVVGRGRLVTEPNLSHWSGGYIILPWEGQACLKHSLPSGELSVRVLTDTTFHIFPLPGKCFASPFTCEVPIHPSGILYMYPLLFQTVPSFLFQYWVGFSTISLSGIEFFIYWAANSPGRGDCTALMWN